MRWGEEKCWHHICEGVVGEKEKEMTRGANDLVLSFNFF